MRSLERLALVGALAAAVTISGTLNARVKDLAQQRDIYQSRAANWEQDALNWQTGDGITASGAPVQAGVTVAADPDILPLGSAVYIEGVGLRYIQDTGSAVKGKALDVAVDTHSEALTWSGYGTHRVWLLEVE